MQHQRKTGFENRQSFRIRSESMGPGWMLRLPGDELGSAEEYSLVNANAAMNENGLSKFCIYSQWFVMRVSLVFPWFFNVFFNECP